MFVTLIALALATAPVGDVCHRPLTCDQKLAACQVNLAKAKSACHPKKSVKHAIVVKEKTCCQVAPTVVVNNNITVSAAASAGAAAAASSEVTFWHRERPSWLLGIRGAGGAAFCAPAGIGLIGLRANYLPWHLGVDVYTEFWHGTGAQVLLYPVQTRIVMWHVNGGAIWFNQRPFLLPNLPRQVDMTLGTGLELRVLPILWVTADLQVRMPNPVAIAATGERFSTVLGKSLVQTQGMLGLMLRTW